MRASHSSRLDSEIGPAVIPSGGEEVRFLYSWNNRLEAIEEAIFASERLEGGGRRGRGKRESRLNRKREEMGWVLVYGG